jgi:transposase InsO family protein
LSTARSAARFGDAASSELGAAGDERRQGATEPRGVERFGQGVVGGAADLAHRLAQPGRGACGGERLGRVLGAVVGVKRNRFNSDAGGQYTAIRYTDALTAVGAVPSIGSVGDGYDNALDESTIGHVKAELIHRRGP